MIALTQTTTERQGLVVRDFEPEDEPAVLEILQLAFREWPREMASADPGEFFRWKHLECPFGASAMYVAEVDGRVVGFEGRIPWRFVAGAGTLLASRGTDLAVHPSYQGRGISLALRRAAVFGPEMAFTWSNPNRESLPGALNFGRRLVGSVPRFVRPGGRLRSTILRAAGQEFAAPEQLPIDAPPARETLADGAPLPLPLPVRGAGGAARRLSTDRDGDYLGWRYAFPDYRAVRGRTRGGEEGIAIFRARRWGRLWGLDVCELIVERGDARLTSSLLGEVSRAAPADFVRCSFPSRAVAARHGFIQYPGRTALVSTPLRERIEPDPTRLSSWALTGGDLELL
ncbi:MAG TPA: GNAT family N-acetyltransferase [Solirubrobacteraceae bacterium]|jgi:GNAT superfamily N-acetyltransferase|nr:GNAT family N-acetyltransferase [Solirubrobacteraceae bacterium]